jgi:hypothetical protein
MHDSGSGSETTVLLVLGKGFHAVYYNKKLLEEKSTHKHLWLKNNQDQDPNI